MEIAPTQWDSASTLSVITEEGSWMIHGGVEGVPPDAYITQLLNAACDVFEVIGVVIRLVGETVEGKDVTFIYSYEYQSRIRVAVAFRADGSDLIEGEWMHFDEHEVTGEQKKILDILIQTRTKNAYRKRNK